VEVSDLLKYAREPRSRPGSGLGLALCLFLAGSAQAADDSVWDKFVDDEGQFDVGEWLGSRYGFLPVPVLITGPTFGAGLGLNLLFLHDSIANDSAASGRYQPPSLSGLVYAATENGTQFGAGYHVGFWRDDTLRTTTFIGYPNANLDFYPTLPVIGEQQISMNLEGWAAYQEVKFRLGDSNYFVGGNYLYLDTKSSPNDVPPFIPDDLLSQQLTTAALAGVLEYDSRDSIFTPSTGTYAKLVAARFDEAVGSDFNFWNLRGKLLHFFPVGDSVKIGLRADGQAVDGTAPYYMYPSIQMRGIASARYQGQQTVVGEIEGRWAVTDRWSLVGFVGSGKAFGDSALDNQGNTSDNPWRTSKGLGFRYTLAKKFNLHAGIDYAIGPEEDSIYITIGHAWDAFF
jgi:outer membrane protein assembly factor BamA